MKFSAQAVLLAVRDTLADPAAAARQVMALGLTAGEAGMALAAAAITATLLTVLMQAILGPIGDPAVRDLFDRPFILAISQFSVMAMGAALMWRVGRSFGGTGTFAQALSLVAWLEAVLILLQLAEVVLILVLPSLAALVGIASLFVLFYLLTHFTAALNGFKSLIKTFFAIMLSAFITLIVLSFIVFLLIPVPHA